MSTGARARSFTLFLGAALTLGVGAEAQRVLSIATLAPAGSSWMRTLESAGRELRRRTNNALAIRWYPGGVQGDDAEVIRKIRSGRLDGAAVTGAGLAQIHRPVTAFELPAIFENPQQFLRARDALAPEVEAAFEQAGFTLLGFQGTGAARMFSDQPIRTPAEFRQAHPWLWPDSPMMPLIYAEVGVTGVPLQLPEVMVGLQQHRINVVYGSPLIMLALQWAPYVHAMSSEGASAMMGGLVVSRAGYQGLAPEHQRAVRELIAEYHVLLARNARREEANAEQALQQRGVQSVTLTPAERQQWLTVFEGVRRRAAGTLASAHWIQRVRDAGRGP